MCFANTMLRPSSSGRMPTPEHSCPRTMGHVIMGYGLSVFSLFGMIALCGVVVNGAFVLAVTQNQMIAEGVPRRDAVLRAAQRRFRPILLTAVTTFLGLGPMIFETSIQALFLIPMAISLGMGTMVSAFVVFFFIPAGLVILEDLRPTSG